MIRPGFESPYPTAISQTGKSRWRLIDHIVWHGYNRDGTELDVECPSGDETDFASSPPAMWSIFPPYGAYTAAAIVHDRMCGVEVPSGRMTYADADHHFRQMLRAAGVSWLRSGCMFTAVRYHSMWCYGVTRHDLTRDVPAVIGFTLLCAPFVVIPWTVNAVFGGLFRAVENIFR